MNLQKYLPVPLRILRKDLIIFSETVYLIIKLGIHVSFLMHIAKIYRPVNFYKTAYIIQGCVKKNFGQILSETFRLFSQQILHF